ncbi:hypothetical protein BCR44DRAFT_1157556 [Catenaria anguillulae PL171]|uniref:Uncharacterized protein n=1 Tax=Catenaria anguillulae PL171 TaxID=765915 RepID=A0A1Y2HIC7_9FUNG|nr:hypothetical protein BCR44DRAFT_1157556 [Catenaria anguillulae PL171]
MTWKKNAKLNARKRATATPVSWPALETTAAGAHSTSAASKLTAPNDRSIDAGQLLADIFRDDFCISRQAYALVKRRDEALANPIQPVRLALPPVCETILIDHLRATVPGKLSPDAAVDGSLGRHVVPTDNVRQLLRDLHSVYAMLEKYLGFDSAVVQRVMFAAPSPWEIGSVLDTACLILPDAELPTGWSDKADQQMRGMAVDSSSADAKVATKREQVGQETIDVANFDEERLMKLGTTAWEKSRVDAETLDFDVGKWTGMMPKDLLRGLLIRMIPSMPRTITSFESDAWLMAR